MSPLLINIPNSNFTHTSSGVTYFDLVHLPGNQTRCLYKANHQLYQPINLFILVNYHCQAYIYVLVVTSIILTTQLESRSCGIRIQQGYDICQQIIINTLSK